MDWLRAPCILWHKAIKSNGYGVIWVNGRLEHAHRFSYELVNGPVPRGLELDHRCRNRACINPDHLEPVARAVNAQRGRRARLASEQVQEARRQFAAGGVRISELAMRYGVDWATMQSALQRRSWINVA